MTNEFNHVQPNLDTPLELPNFDKIVFWGNHGRESVVTCAREIVDNNNFGHMSDKALLLLKSQEKVFRDKPERHHLKEFSSISLIQQLTYLVEKQEMKYRGFAVAFAILGQIAIENFITQSSWINHFINLDSVPFDGPFLFAQLFRFGIPALITYLASKPIAEYIANRQAAQYLDMESDEIKTMRRASEIVRKEISPRS